MSLQSDVTQFFAQQQTRRAFLGRTAHGVGKVALAWVGVNGREERQIVESVMDQYPDTWRTEWLRLKGLPQWAEYFQTLEEAIVVDEIEEVAICARA